MNDAKGSNRPSQPPTRVDQITGAVIQGALENIAIEMGPSSCAELSEHHCEFKISARRLPMPKDGNCASAK